MLIATVSQEHSEYWRELGDGHTLGDGLFNEIFSQPRAFLWIDGNDKGVLNAIPGWRGTNGMSYIVSPPSPGQSGTVCWCATARLPLADLYLYEGNGEF